MREENGKEKDLTNEAAATPKPIESDLKAGTDYSFGDEKTQNRKEAFSSQISDDEDLMLSSLGFSSFGSTKETKVKGNSAGEAKIIKKTKRQYRQFMHKKFHEKKKSSN